MLNKISIELPEDKLEFPEDEIYSNQRSDLPGSPVKYIAVDLHPTILEAGLVASLEWLACDFEEKNTIPVQFNSNVSEIHLDASMTIGIFSIAQEACNNISKHANASSVEMYLYNAENKLQLEIVDNGCGMDSLQQRNMASSGLFRMRQRTVSLGGDFMIASKKEHGTIIRICMPVF
jgi:signal transduction histidine kinase